VAMVWAGSPRTYRSSASWRSLAMAVRSACSARIAGVYPRATLVGLAPASSRSFTASTLPSDAAQWSGVSSRELATLTFAPFAMSSAMIFGEL